MTLVDAVVIGVDTQTGFGPPGSRHARRGLS